MNTRYNNLRLLMDVFRTDVHEVAKECPSLNLRTVQDLYHQRKICSRNSQLQVCKAMKIIGQKNEITTVDIEIVTQMHFLFPLGEQKEWNRASELVKRKRLTKAYHNIQSVPNNDESASLLAQVLGINQ